MSNVQDIDLTGREARKRNDGDERDEWARKNAFLVLTPGEAYAHHVSLTGIVFIYQIENGKWITVYDNTRQDDKGNTWKSGNIKAGATKDESRIFGVTWDKAAEAAVRFVKYMTHAERR